MEICPSQTVYPVMGTYDCDAITKLTIPGSVVTIQDLACYSCNNVAELVLGNGVVTIGNDAFAATLITELIIPDSVTTIGNGAFRCFSYTPLSRLTIGAGVTSILPNAFGECTSLTEVYLADPATQQGLYAWPSSATIAPRPQATSATGDPHLQNLHGERFDLARPGEFELIRIPRGEPAEDALLIVQADARQVGGPCTDLYFVELNVTGAWADGGGLRFDAFDEREDTPTWKKLGPVYLKVAYGRTAEGTRYLNFYVKNLGRAGFPVGGLLGEDDYKDVSTPPDGCLKRVSLSRSGHSHGSSAMSIADGSLV